MLFAFSVLTNHISEKPTITRSYNLQNDFNGKMTPTLYLYETCMQSVLVIICFNSIYFKTHGRGTQASEQAHKFETKIS